MPDHLLRTATAAVVAGVALLGCDASEPAPPALPSELATLVDRFWDFYLNWHPLEATYLGEEGYDDLLPDVTPGARAARHSQAT
ncbi:MAG: hypothetical protein R3266_10760, partial [Gemmatimonadota bacterium]|nr:hypothetical protein [Gemmatimonadota bacterium]